MLNLLKISFVTLLLGLSSLSFADTIGYVQMQRVFSEYTETKKAEETFKKQQDKFKKEFEKREAKIKKAQDKGKSEEHIEELTKKLEDELKPKQEQLMQLHTQLMGKIKQDINLAIKGVAQSYGIDVVLNKDILIQGPVGPIDNQPVILHGGFDMTEFVIEKLNK